MGLGLFDDDDDDLQDMNSLEEAIKGNEELSLLKKLLNRQFYTKKSEDKKKIFLKWNLEPFLETLELKEKLKFIKLIEKNIKKQEKLDYLKVSKKSKVIAVGGGFSSGKSRFINSILGEEILPVGLNPTTSIPTFIGNRKESKQIRCLTFDDREVIITEEELEKIAHKFEENTGISLIRIIKILSIETEILKKQELFILDTPGYTKSDHYKKNDNTDSFIAREHLSVVDCLIWVIDIENGTIKDDDIQFIKQLNFTGPLIFIINKADKKIEIQIKKIKSDIEKTLQRNNIVFHCVIAYSSEEKKEYFSNHLENIFSYETFITYEDDKKFIQNFMIDIERYFSEEEELQNELGKKIGGLLGNPKILCTEYNSSVLESLYQNNYNKKKINALKLKYKNEIKPKLEKIIAEM